MWSSIALLVLPFLLRTALCIPSPPVEEPLGLEERERDDEIPTCTGNLPPNLQPDQPFSTNQELCVESANEDTTPSLFCRCLMSGELKCFSTQHFHRPPPFFRRRRQYQRHCKRNCECPNAPDSERSRRPGILGTMLDSVSNPSIGGQVSSNSLNIDPVLGSFAGTSHGTNIVAVAGAGTGTIAGAGDAVYPSALDLKGNDNSCIGQTCSSFADCACGESVVCVWRSLSAGLYFALGECVKVGSAATFSSMNLHRGPFGGGGRRRRKRDVRATLDGPPSPSLPPLQEKIQSPTSLSSVPLPVYTEPCKCDATHSDLLCCPILPGSVLWQDEWGLEWENEDKDEDKDQNEREAETESLLLTEKV